MKIMHMMVVGSAKIFFFSREKICFGRHIFFGDDIDFRFRLT